MRKLVTSSSHSYFQGPFHNTAWINISFKKKKKKKLVCDSISLFEICLFC